MQEILNISNSYWESYLKLISEYNIPFKLMGIYVPAGVVIRSKIEGVFLKINEFTAKVTNTGTTPYRLVFTSDYPIHYYDLLSTRLQRDGLNHNRYDNRATNAILQLIVFKLSSSCDNRYHLLRGYDLSKGKLHAIREKAEDLYRKYYGDHPSIRMYISLNYGVADLVNHFYEHITSDPVCKEAIKNTPHECYDIIMKTNTFVNYVSLAQN